MNKHDVAICIPTYERADIFQLCLESLLSQTHKRLTVHVFDNSRTDSVLDVIKSIGDDRVRYERNLANVTDVPEINHRKAFQPQSSDYQMILTSDWALRPDAIELMVARLCADPNIVAVTSGLEKRDPQTGTTLSSEPIRLRKFAVDGGALIDTAGFIYAAFKGYAGIGICYHSLLVTDVLRGGMIVPHYYGQASEHELGLDLAILRPRIGVINECLLIGLRNREQFKAQHYRKDVRLNETIARARFFDRQYPVLIAKGFDTERMRRWLTIRFIRSAFASPAHAGGALILAKRYGLPWWIAAIVWWILLPARGVAALTRQ